MVKLPGNFKEKIATAKSIDENPLGAESSEFINAESEQPSKTSKLEINFEGHIPKDVNSTAGRTTRSTVKKGNSRLDVRMIIIGVLMVVVVLIMWYIQNQKKSSGESTLDTSILSTIVDPVATPIATERPIVRPPTDIVTPVPTQVPSIATPEPTPVVTPELSKEETGSGEEGEPKLVQIPSVATVIDNSQAQWRPTSRVPGVRLSSPSATGAFATGTIQTEVSGLSANILFIGVERSQSLTKEWILGNKWQTQDPLILTGLVEPWMRITHFLGNITGRDGAKMTDRLEILFAIEIGHTSLDGFDVAAVEFVLGEYLGGALAPTVTIAPGGDIITGLNLGSNEEDPQEDEESELVEILGPVRVPGMIVSDPGVSQYIVVPVTAVAWRERNGLTFTVSYNGTDFEGECLIKLLTEHPEDIWIDALTATASGALANVGEPIKVSIDDVNRLIGYLELLQALIENPEWVLDLIQGNISQ